MFSYEGILSVERMSKDLHTTCFDMQVSYFICCTDLGTSIFALVARSFAVINLLMSGIWLGFILPN